MNAKRPLVALAALVMFSAVFASAPVAAQDSCNVMQTNNQANLLNVNTDTNVNAVNAAANVPLLSPNTGDGDQSAESNQMIQDSGDSFQSQSNYAKC